MKDIEKKKLTPIRVEQTREHSVALYFNVIFADEEGNEYSLYKSAFKFELQPQAPDEPADIL